MSRKVASGKYICRFIINCEPVESGKINLAYLYDPLLNEDDHRVNVANFVFSTHGPDVIKVCITDNKDYCSKRDYLLN